MPRAPAKLATRAITTRSPPIKTLEDVSADLFYYAGKTYLVYVDCLSG